MTRRIAILSVAYETRCLRTVSAYTLRHYSTLRALKYGRLDCKMKINTSYLISGLAIVLIALWFLANTGGTKSDNTTSKPKAEETALPTVIIQTVSAVDHPRTLDIYGRTEPNRTVSVKAETAGLVVATPVSEGRIIGAGTIICRQDVDARQALVDQANANLKSREFDFKSTQTLVKKGYRSAIQLENLKAQVDGARASVMQANIELDNVNMRAPFKGLFTEQIAEVGDYLSPGQACGRLLEMNPLVITGELTESQVGSVEIGQETTVHLATGHMVKGQIRFINPTANPSTRTFRFEIATPNDDYALKGGVTASVKLETGFIKAHRIPGRILSLGTQGDVGVRYLDDVNRVRFTKVQTIDEDGDGVWVTGLPDTARVIVQGQDYVSEGVEVSPQTQSGSPS